MPVFTLNLSPGMGLGCEAFKSVSNTIILFPVVLGSLT